jgi:hypothetical protein
MQTIKQAATEKMNSLCFPKNKEEFRIMIHRAFCAGAEFAQRWTPVEKELPPCSDIDILIKGIDDEGREGIVDIGYMHESVPRVENFVSLGGVLREVTHWRYIELK